MNRKQKILATKWILLSLTDGISFAVTPMSLGVADKVAVNSFYQSCRKRRVQNGIFATLRAEKILDRTA